MIYRFVCGSMVVMFVFSTVVQFNDPDAWRWIALYAMAAAAPSLALAGRLPRWLAPVITVVAIAWLALIAGPAWRAVPESAASLAGFTMQDINVELVREAGGLLIVAGCMLALSLWRPAPGR